MAGGTSFLNELKFALNKIHENSKPICDGENLTNNKTDVTFKMNGEENSTFCSDEVKSSRTVSPKCEEEIKYENESTVDNLSPAITQKVDRNANVLGNDNTIGKANSSLSACDSDASTSSQRTQSSSKQGDFIRSKSVSSKYRKQCDNMAFAVTRSKDNQLRCRTMGAMSSPHAELYEELNKVLKKRNQRAQSTSVLDYEHFKTGKTITFIGRPAGSLCGDETCGGSHGHLNRINVDTKFSTSTSSINPSSISYPSPDYPSPNELSIPEQQSHLSSEIDSEASVHDDSLPFRQAQRQISANLASYLHNNLPLPKPESSDTDSAGERHEYVNVSRRQNVVRVKSCLNFNNNRNKIHNNDSKFGVGEKQVLSNSDSGNGSLLSNPSPPLAVEKSCIVDSSLNSTRDSYSNINGKLLVKKTVNKINQPIIDHHDLSIKTNVYDIKRNTSEKDFINVKQLLSNGENIVHRRASLSENNSLQGNPLTLTNKPSLLNMQNPHSATPFEAERSQGNQSQVEDISLESKYTPQTDLINTSLKQGHSCDTQISIDCDNADGSFQDNSQTDLTSLDEHCPSDLLSQLVQCARQQVAPLLMTAPSDSETSDVTWDSSRAVSVMEDYKDRQSHLIRYENTMINETSLKKEILRKVNNVNQASDLESDDTTRSSRSGDQRSEDSRFSDNSFQYGGSSTLEGQKKVMNENVKIRVMAPEDAKMLPSKISEDSERSTQKSGTNASPSATVANYTIGDNFKLQKMKTDKESIQKNKSDINHQSHKSSSSRTDRNHQSDMEFKNIYCRPSKNTAVVRDPNNLIGIRLKSNNHTDKDVITDLMITHSGERIPPDGADLCDESVVKQRLVAGSSVTIPTPTSFHQHSSNVGNHFINTSDQHVNNNHKICVRQNSILGSCCQGDTSNPNTTNSGSLSYDPRRYEKRKCDQRGGLGSSKRVDKESQRYMLYYTWTSTVTRMRQNPHRSHWRRSMHDVGHNNMAASRYKDIDSDSSELGHTGWDNTSSPGPGLMNDDTPSPALSYNRPYTRNSMRDLQSVQSLCTYVHDYNEHSSDADTESLYQDYDDYERALIQYVHTEDLHHMSDDIRSLYRQQLDTSSVASNAKHFLHTLTCCWFCRSRMSKGQRSILSIM